MSIVTENNHTLNWNVIDESSFKSRVREIFTKVSETLTNTLGPYGANTIIEQFGDMHITKDGWNILKKISFDDATDNNLLNLLVNISAQVVIKVGDGSTSSIVSANAILKELESNPHITGLRSKEVLDLLAEAINDIVTVIQQDAVKINEEDEAFEDIYKLAMISTNGAEDISRIIQSIYSRTKNPFIDFKKSKTNRTHHEIIEGFQTNITYIDRIYITNEDATCEIDNPIVLMFDHRVDKEFSFEKVIQPAVQKALAEGRRLVVVAPHYDRYFLEYISRVTSSEYRSTGTTSIVYSRVSLINNMTNEIYNDFSVMTGGRIIRESDIELLDKGEILIDEFVGAVDHISIGQELTTIRGFSNRRQSMYDLTMNDAIAKYQQIAEKHEELNIVNTELYEMKKRISKLRGIMGVIHVGGHSSLEKTSNFDLVEDAVKACESAYNYGYNIGGNLIIPLTIKKIYPEVVELADPVGITTKEIVYKLLYNAFRNVFATVVANKFSTLSRTDILEQYVDSSIEQAKCYDLITDEFTDNVINPCRTDIEILRAATSIVSLLLSSNQYISINIPDDKRNATV